MARGELKVNGQSKSVGTCIMRRASTRINTRLYHELIGAKQAGCDGEMTKDGGNITACKKHLEEIKFARYILRLPPSNNRIYKSR